jgi:hypothetical protein
MGMEENAKNFLVLIVQTVSSIILWLLINILLGLYLKYGIFENAPSLINIGYYILFIVGSFLLFKYFKKRWNSIDLNQ